MKMKPLMLFACAGIAAVGMFGATAPSPKEPVRDSLMCAIRMAESSGNPNPPDGDGGKSIGPYQIGKLYFQDAIEFDKSIGGTYEDCRKQEYAERIVQAYMRRYAPYPATDERIARLHNGGCNLWKSEDAKQYWLTRVKPNLKD